MKVAFCLLVLAAAGLAATFSFAQTKGPQAKSNSFSKPPNQAVVKVGKKWIVVPNNSGLPLASVPYVPNRNALPNWNQFQAMVIPIKPDPSHPPKFYLNPRPLDGTAFLAIKP